MIVESRWETSASTFLILNPSLLELDLSAMAEYRLFRTSTMTLPDGQRTYTVCRCSDCYRFQICSEIIRFSMILYANFYCPKRSAPILTMFWITLPRPWLMMLTVTKLDDWWFFISFSYPLICPFCWLWNWICFWPCVMFCSHPSPWRFGSIFYLSP